MSGGGGSEQQDTVNSPMTYGSTSKTATSLPPQTGETQPIGRAVDRRQEAQPPQTSSSIFTSLIQAVFGFRKTSLTLFVFMTYILVGGLVFVAKEKSLSIPANAPDELQSAWLDLQKISSKPHPYISHANDEVHDYIVKRVTELASKSKFVNISDDAKEKLNMFKIIPSWWNATSDYSPLHYFESSNVLVKVEGQDPTLEGLLLSSHYDSVPTAYGTTDDGTGVAAMLGVLEHIVSSGARPLRTIVFNFNNNEEFGLFGAEAFLNHPWRKLVSYVINLEGTGTGERAILFRSTDYEVAKIYQSVRSPFGSSIFQQGFASGFVHSETDYRVYSSNGLRGVDIAFYKPRSLYHTAKDAIRYSSKNALWHMLSNTLDLTNAIANSKEIGEDNETQAVYFDILGYYFVVLPANTLIIANMALLTIVPLVLILFGIVIKKREIWSIGYIWTTVLVSFAISGIVTKFLSETIASINPFIVSRDFYSPLIALSSTFLFINYALLTISHHFYPVHDFKLVITLVVFVALWLALLYSTVTESQSSSITGEYLISIVYTLYSISVFLGLFGISIARPRRISNGTDEELPYSTEDTQDESSPLLSNSIPVSDTEDEDHVHGPVEKGHPEHNSFTYDWSLQFLLLVPISFLLTYISATLVLEGINQTMQESLESQHVVFVVLLASSIALTTPLLSFSYKLNYLFALFLVVSIFLATASSLLSNPFSAEAPLKFRFAQTIDLDTKTPEPKVEVFGRAGFLSDILGDLPSVKSSGQDITCTPQPDGNELCNYVSERPYLVDGSADDLFSYLTINVVKSGAEADPSPYAPLTAEIKIATKYNRFCSLSFNSTSYKSGVHGKSPLRLLTYYHDKFTNKSLGSLVENNIASVPSGPSKDADGNDVYKYLSGIDAVHLHKLSWNQGTYHLGLQWIPKWLEDGEEQEPSGSPNNKLGVTVSCFWGEYDDASVVDGEIKRKIPAFDELLQYTPRTSSFSNRYEGLVRIDRYITL